MSDRSHHGDDENQNQIQNMKTKNSALTALLAAGFNAELNAAGLRVWGDNWEAQFTDLGQDHDTFIGQVPEQVHELAVWDDAATRNEIATTELYNITLNAASQKSAEQIQVGFLLVQNMGYGKKTIADEQTDLRQAVRVMRAGLTDRQSEQLEQARFDRTGVTYDENGTIAEEFSETVGDLIDALNISDYICSITAK